MGISSSSLLDESKSNYIKGQVEAELKNFSPYYRRQYLVVFFSKVQDEVEQKKMGQTQLLKQREPPKPAEVLYEENVLYFDDTRKWKERFVVVRANYSLECHDSYETFMKGVPPRHKLLPTGGTVLTSEDKYMAMVDECFPDLNSVKEEFAPPMATMPGQFPVYLRLPYRRDSYFCFRLKERQTQFISILTECIRHQNHDFLKKTACEVQTFLKAIQFYRQEKGRYESWDMLIGSDVRVLANLMMEELLPSLQTDLMSRLKGKKTDRKKAWFATVEAAYILVQEQLLKGLTALKEECREMAKQQEPCIRSNMDQIISSQDYLEGKLKDKVMERAEKFCSEHVQPYLASILEDLMGPISFGFQEVRLLCEKQMDQLCQDFQESCKAEELRQALQKLRKTSLQNCYQHVDVLREQLKQHSSRYNFSNCSSLVHSTQLDMQQLMDNAVYTFEMMLQTALKDNPAKPGSVMEKAKLRVLKQYDYDSSTVRKRIFHDALLQITLPSIKKNLAPQCKSELPTFEEFIFADYTNFIQVENVYEDILLQTLEREVSKVVKEAASLKKHNLFVDGTDMRLFSQSSVYCPTPPGSLPASPDKKLDSSPLRNGQLESQRQDTPTAADLVEKADKLIPTETVKGETANTAEAEGITPTVAETEKASSPGTAEAEEIICSTAEAEKATLTSTTEAEKESLSSTAEAEENTQSAAEAEQTKFITAEANEVIPATTEADENVPSAAEPENVFGIAEAPKEDMPSVAEPEKEDMPSVAEAEKEDMATAAEAEKDDMPSAAEGEKEDTPISAEPTKEDTDEIQEDVPNVAEAENEDTSIAAEKIKEAMPIAAEPMKEDTPSVAAAEKADTPTVAEGEKENTPSVAEAQKEDMPIEAEPMEEDTTNVAEAQKDNTPSAADEEKEDTPIATELMKEDTPSVAEAEKEDMPTVSEPSKEDTPSVAEAEKANTPSVAEAENKDTPSVAEAENKDLPSAAEAENKDMPRVAEIESVETAVHSDTPSPSPDTDSAGDENLDVDTTVSVSAPLAETGADNAPVSVTDEAAEVKDSGTETVLTQPPEHTVTDAEAPSPSDSNAGEVNEDSTQDRGDSGAISPGITVAEETEEGGTASSGTDSTEEVTESDFSLTSDHTAEGTEGSAVTLSVDPISEVTEKGVCLEAGPTVEREVLSAEPTMELTQSTLPTAAVSPRVSPVAEVKPAEEPADEKSQAPDCIREIRDLVVEVIEVEELVQRYPDSGSA